MDSECKINSALGLVTLTLLILILTSCKSSNSAGVRFNQNQWESTNSSLISSKIRNRYAHHKTKDFLRGSGSLTGRGLGTKNGFTVDRKKFELVSFKEQLQDIKDEPKREDELPNNDQDFEAKSSIATNPDAIQRDRDRSSKIAIAVATAELNEPLPLEETGENLELIDVLCAVEASFPMLAHAALQRNIACGNQVSAWGAFDTNLYGTTTNQPLGFYQNYRQGIGIQQQSLNRGAVFSSGYRIGDGDFPVWYGDRQTNEGGEFSISAIVPLRKNRLIDPQRAALFKAQADLSAFEPFFASERNRISRDAAIVYWNWIDAGNNLTIQERLTQLARDRAKQIALRVEKGDLPRLSGIDNDRLIAQRETKLLEATRKFQGAAINLALYLRNENGEPMLADASFLPENFPDIPVDAFISLENDIQVAQAQHPGLAELDIEIRKADIDRKLARNSTLGKLDFVVGSSQDVGTPATPENDKTPFELEAGLKGELPLQRREGFGRLQVTEAKIQQWELQRNFLKDKISIAVRDSYSAYDNAIEQRVRANQNRDLAQKALQIARDSFNEGAIDMIVLNIYEQALAEAELLTVAAQVAIQQALVDYWFAKGNVDVWLSDSENETQLKRL